MGVRGGLDNAINSRLLTEEWIWLLFADIARGLRHLHSRSILHRDLKPSNILLHIDEHSSPSRVPRAMLSDFGTCEMLGEGASLASHVQGGYAVEFMAPERLRGEESDEPADMWSAGLCLYAMCYGDLPYHSDTPEDCRRRVMEHKALPKLDSFRSQILRDLIHHLSAALPEERPSAEHALQQALVALQLLQDEQIGTPPGSCANASPSEPAPPRMHSLPDGATMICDVARPRVPALPSWCRSRSF